MLNKETVGKNIATQRKLQGMTQKEIADILHVSYQAVSQWESGKSLPTVEMLYDLATVLDVTMEALLNDVSMASRDISYKDSGLDTAQLYVVKGKVHKLVSENEHIVRSGFQEPLFFKADTAGIKKPVYVTSTHVPGSKARLGREQGFDKEICMDLVARAINCTCCMGAKPQVFQAHLVGGNVDGDLLCEMAKSFQETCEKNGVIFGGMGIGAQPVNFRTGEYELSAGIIGVCEEEKINFGESLKEGDVLVAMQTEGIDAVSYPYVRVMFDRRPALRYAKIDKEHTFIEELLKPNAAYSLVIEELSSQGLIHGAFRMSNSIVKDSPYWNVPEHLIARIDMETIKIPQLFRFIEKQGMIGRNFLPYKFAFGVGMIAAIPENRVEVALKIIRKYHDCYIIGGMERNSDSREERVKTTGEMKWQG